MIAQPHIAELLTDLPDHARVWIYQCNRPLLSEEVAYIESQSKNFLREWNAHGSAMHARALVVYDRFLILAADEQRVQASGCSIDSSVHFIKSLGNHLKVDFFDRLAMSYRDESGSILTLPLNRFQEEIAQGNISQDTLVFNNLVDNVGELKSKWEVPASQSWHIRLFS